MSSTHRITIFVGILIGVVITGGIAWWIGGPSTETVRRTVVTTIQEESPASFLVTGTLEISTTVHVDSTSTLTPGWVTSAVQMTQPQLLPFTQGTARVRIRVPGTVSYGFDVRDLDPEMIRVGRDGVINVEIPDLTIHSVAPDLRRLELQTSSSGWMKLFTGEMQKDVRSSALKQVEATFREQATVRLEQSTQPRVNTARALEAMLTPPLVAAGWTNPRFRFQIEDDLVLMPSPAPSSSPSPSTGPTPDSSERDSMDPRAQRRGEEVQSREEAGALP